MKTKIIVICIAAIALLIALFFALNHFIYMEKQGTGEPVEPYRGTLTGTRDCLPQKGPGPHTMECAPGFKTDAGEYYVFDTMLMSQIPPEIEMGVRFSATGVITPIENLSTDEWQKYEVVGVFSVTNSIEMITEEEPEPPVSNAGPCYIGGCSSQLCGDEPGMASTCEYRDEYACYQTATCERQASGQCGWTPSAELTSCLAGN